MFDKNGHSNTSGLLKIIGNCLFGAAVIVLTFILVSVLTARTAGKTPSVFGNQIYRIESGSMDPTLHVGSMILSHNPGDSSALKKDNIITFINSNGLTVTHRIVEVVVSEDGLVHYRTQGDNPINSPDTELVSPEMIQAVFVMKIPLT